jgi:Uma2 family endonuclease
LTPDLTRPLESRVMSAEIERARRLFTVDEYQRMVDVGILTKYDHVELIHGEIVEMTPIGEGHFGTVNALVTLFVERLGRRAVVGTSGSLRLPPRSMPEPDLLLLAPRADFYRRTRISPEHVLLVIEVADTSLRYDRQVKLPLYAAAGIAEYWIVDVEGQAVEVYRAPAGTRYSSVTRVGREGSVSPEAFGDAALSVTDIVG